MNESMDERATLVTPLSTEPLTEGAIRQAQDNAQRLNVIHSRLMAVCSRIGVPPAPGKPRADEDRKVADSFLGKFKERRARPGRRSRAGPQLEEIAMRKAAAVLSWLFDHKTDLLAGGAVGAGATILIGGDVGFGWLAFFTCLGALVGVGVQWLALNWYSL